jgi:thymidine kinase
MRQRIIVDKDQIDQLPQDLVDIKRSLVTHLNDHLDSAWDIYVYPFMNGDRPSLVLFNPFVGIQFIEIIRGRREEYTFEEVVSEDGLKYRKYAYRGNSAFHLVGRVRTYRDKLINLYIPQIREKIDRDPKVLAAFAISIYFPDMSTSAAKELINDEHCLAFGNDELGANSINNIVASHERRVGFAIQPEWVEAIEDWLNPQYQALPEIHKGLPTTHSTTEQRIHPSWQEVARFRTPRTEGEITLAKNLDEKLPSDWEIFIEPFLNGDRPDFALLHAEYGLWIIEVKDWNPNNYVRRDSKVYVRDARGEHFLSRERRPDGQLRRYQENIARLVQSDFGGRLSPESVKYGIYFHYMTKAQAQNLFAFDTEIFVIGCDNLNEIIPTIIMRDRCKARLEPKQINILKSWLLPPKHFLDQIHPISLDKEQLRYAKIAPHKHQVLQGVAGSGKSLVLAQRAANLAEQGKRVLVVSFNITLWHYLRDLVSRTGNFFNRKLIEYNHFHGFCRDFLKENGIEWGTTDQDTNSLLNITVPNLVLSSMRSGINAKNRIYDAILIDEGQDYLPLWYEALCAFLSKNDEVLLVSDPGQNVYRRNLELQDAKFDRLKVMQRSYRLPGRVREQAERFAQAFFPDMYITNGASHKENSAMLSW